MIVQLYISIVLWIPKQVYDSTVIYMYSFMDIRTGYDSTVIYMYSFSVYA